MNEHTEYDEKLKDDGERSGSRMTAGDEQALVALADLFKVFGDPTRTRILGCLQNGSLCVGEIAEALGMSLSAVSHQLRVLRAAKLVRGIKEGKEVKYSLDDDHVTRIMECGLSHVKEDR